jgi:dCMP deaminase
MKEARPCWPETWMAMAREVARRSCDPALKVGCIIVPSDNTAVLALGYNGMWRGGPNEVESLERGKSGTVHAEVNALIKCDFSFHKPKHLYVTASPCRDCAKLIVNGGISRVVYDVPYRDTAGVDLLLSAGVEVLALLDAVVAYIPA